MQINRMFTRALPISTLLAVLTACGGPAPRQTQGQPVPPPAPIAQPLPRPLPQPLPRPLPQPARQPTPHPLAPAPHVAANDWRDVALPPGDWTWEAHTNGSEARFGPAGAPPLAWLVCDRAVNTVWLALPVGAPSPGIAHPATIATSTASGTFGATVQTMRGMTTLAIGLPATNRILDAMAFSRGRFLVEIAGAAPTVLPSWSEVGRVIEDCRVPAS